jgi:4-hydroxybenzoate polyprenyltransferase
LSHFIVSYQPPQLQLFFGILGREITMDCNDVENDRAVGVRTIPVVHGPVYASRIAFASAAMSAMLALMGPLGQITKLPTSVWTRRLGFAATASIIQMYGAWRVMRTEGRNREVVTTSVDAGVKTILLFVASYF